MVAWVKSLISRWVLNAGGSQYVVRVDILMETLGCQAPSTAWAKSSLLSRIFLSVSIFRLCVSALHTRKGHIRRVNLSRYGPLAMAWRKLSIFVAKPAS